jgi:putative SOS response-associated peptidase YedK
MCGRFTLRVSPSVVAEQFSLFEAPMLESRFNIAPSQPAPVVRAAPGPDEPPRQLVLLRWGLIPSWADDPAIGNRLINARAETAAQKPAFRAAMRRRRCLVVADGFYEWQRVAKRRQPWFIRMGDDRPFGFAGLWEAWEGADHSAIESCTILTTDANELVRPIHDRMPAIIEKADYDRWLDPANEKPESLLPLLRPYPSDRMMACPVGTLVNSPSHEGPALLQETSGSLFGP